jgi:hypothetical protein
MNPPTRHPAARPAIPAETTGLGPGATALAAWLVPGAGHLAHGQAQKAGVFFLVLTAMYAIGLSFGGRLFPFQFSDLLVLLAAGAEWSCGLPRLVAAGLGAGGGRVVAVTYEYGNAFLIAAGLLNIVVVLDALDLATGRKPR